MTSSGEGINGAGRPETHKFAAHASEHTPLQEPSRLETRKYIPFRVHMPLGEWRRYTRRNRAKTAEVTHFGDLVACARPLTFHSKILTLPKLEISKALQNALQHSEFSKPLEEQKRNKSVQSE